LIRINIIFLKSSFTNLNLLTNLFGGIMTKKLMFLSVVCIFAVTAFSQDYRVVPNPTHSTNIIPYADIRSHYTGALPGYDNPETQGDSCAQAPGYEHHDISNAHANGYLYFLDSVRFVLATAPPGGYPWVYNKVCVGWTDVGSVTAVTYYIVLYDSSAGTPSTLLYVSPAQTATGIPVYPSYAWYSSTVTLPAINHPCFIGVRWDYTTTGAMYMSSDEATADPLWLGYMATVNTPPTWATIQTFGGNFPNYKCMAIRSGGSSPLPPLCENFEEGTFPPTGWTVAYTGTNYWLYAAVSGFGVGSHSAEYDMYDASAGTNQTLKSVTFVPTVDATKDLIFDIAYAPYPASPPYAQDSLVVMTSTDGGTTFTSLIRLGPTDMQTAPATTSPFVPTASQWDHRNYLMPLGTNAVEFIGESQFGNDLYIDSVCTETNLLGLTQTQTGVPKTYSLSQNYPNPFNPSTNIKFDLPKAGIVKLVIYDVLGREVKTLVNEYKQAGEFNIQFDASNIASGVYFYRIEANDFTATKKMLLIK